MIVITYGELVLMALGIGVMWVLFFWGMLNLLDKWGFLKPDYEHTSDDTANRAQNRAKKG